jgi:hypothetical protein
MEEAELPTKRRASIPAIAATVAFAAALHVDLCAGGWPAIARIVLAPTSYRVNGPVGRDPTNATDIADLKVAVAIDKYSHSAR